MENINQIVIQLTEITCPIVRALAQYGSDIYQPQQYEVIYSELTDNEKIIWDNFMEMIKNKQ
jgi:hypothetical protein